MLRLEDVCKKASSNIAQNELAGRDGEYPIYGASGLIKDVDFFQQDKPYIAIVKDGAGVGRVMKLPAYSSVIGTMQYIIPNDNVDVSYLAYALEHMNLSKYYTGATIPHIYFKDYKSEILPDIPLEIQHEIAYNLDKVSEAIELCQKILEKLDYLVKAKFAEMFGEIDLSKEQDSWMPIAKIGTVVSGATPKTNNPEYWDGEYRWITPAELDNAAGYIYDSVRKLTKAGIESCSLQKLPVGTVILSSRAPIGKVAIAGATFYCNQGFKNIICGDSVNPVYLYALLQYNTTYLNELGRGATFKEISKSIVNNIKIPVPPLQLQEQFAEYVKKTDLAKSAVKKTLEKAQTLKNALMQKYFG